MSSAELDEDKKFSEIFDTYGKPLREVVITLGKNLDALKTEDDIKNHLSGALAAVGNTTCTILALIPPDSRHSVMKGYISQIIADTKDKSDFLQEELSGMYKSKQ